MVLTMENMEALVSGIHDRADARGLKMTAASIPGDPDVLFYHPDWGWTTPSMSPGMCPHRS